MKTKNMKTLPIGNSINRSPLRRSLLLIPLALTCFALSPRAGAVSPKPDGGYPNQNTAEGDNALFSLTTAFGNTAIGHSALFSNTAGGNTATGAEALFSNTTGNSETANGFAALFSNTVGLYNTATGESALYFNTSGSENTASGKETLVSNTTGSNNTADGALALLSNTTGGRNTALGNFAGHNLTTGDNNIDIGWGVSGVAAEANTIRIGTQGTQTATFIAGISGTAVTGAAVVVTSSGQLGVAPSSERFKDAIEPMGNASEAVLALKPVTFHYKKEIDPKGIPQFGLLAEEVEKVNPTLVIRDAKGEVYTVRYEAVNAMLLNEFLKEHRKVEEQDRKLSEQDRKVQEQETAIIQLKSTVAQQQKGMEAFAATLKEQASQIQKVSAQLQVSKAASQRVADSQ
jgi:Chaperone of endosialidase